MRKIKQSTILLYLVIVMIAGSSCKKFLDEKQRQSLAIPSTLLDFQSLLDQNNVVLENDPGAGEISADDYYLTAADWSSRTEPHRRIYTWEKDYLFPSGFNDWSNIYRVIYRTNSILDNIDKVPVNTANQLQWSDVKGQAYFFRAKGFLQAAIIWAPAYNKTSAATDMGIPLRLNADFNEPSVRSSVKDSYQQIINDAKMAAALLPVTVIHVVRPNRAAALALVARTYLAMGEFDSCGKYDGESLQLNSALLNFNNLNSSATYPFSPYPYGLNPEILHDSFMPNPSPLNNARGKIDSVLYRSFDANDLRKTVFFKNNNNGTYGFKGSYEGGAELFSGLATDEVYLMKAECLARTGNKTTAMNTLNQLLANRYKTGTFTPLNAVDANDALNIILSERRKELMFRGLRWMDIKRFNVEGRGIVLKRVINSDVYILAPNDMRYALPIPEDVIELSGMQQNPR